MIRLYLAGPEVFHRDALQLGMAKQLLCARFHYQGLYPLDGAPPPGQAGRCERRSTRAA